jgi:hypothetical protein
MEDLGESRLTLDTTGDHTTLVHSTPLIKSRPSVDSSLVRGGVLEVWRRRPESNNVGDGGGESETSIGSEAFKSDNGGELSACPSAVSLFTSHLITSGSLSESELVGHEEGVSGRESTSRTAHKRRTHLADVISA